MPLTDEQLAAIRAAAENPTSFTVLRDGIHGEMELAEIEPSEILDLLADRDEMREVLRAVEWAGPDHFFRNAPYCPQCGNYQTTGHKSDCPIGKVLAATEQEEKADGHAPS